MLEFLFSVIGLGIVMTILIVIPINLTVRSKVVYGLASFLISTLCIFAYHVFETIWPLLLIVCVLSIILGLLILSYIENKTTTLSGNVQLASHVNQEEDLDFLTTRVENLPNSETEKIPVETNEVDFEKLLSQEPVDKG
ncbi:hypothetical protein [Metabacillus malikii]|uniref:Uncharacterized protein n=1 Tax=Metabacillus malikii TaxID=1504265 RepID=A0ABT9ZKJ2_9BACI|nr:hypothetical protein [Metabacillus malikii]MDQ0232812.1 hypothetical protein [Metabacillus malikii]